MFWCILQFACIIMICFQEKYNNIYDTNPPHALPTLTGRGHIGFGPDPLGVRVGVGVGVGVTLSCLQNILRTSG